jgi:hypothetical protein
MTSWEQQENGSGDGTAKPNFYHTGHAHGRAPTGNYMHHGSFRPYTVGPVVP